MLEQSLLANIGGQHMLSKLKEYRYLIAVFASVFFTIWLVVGSIWFPPWWYKAIFTGRNTVLDSVAEGFDLLLQNYLIQLIFILLLVIVSIIYVFKYRDYVSRIADSFAARIIAVCLLLILFDILILNSTQRPVIQGENEVLSMLAQSQALLEIALDRVGNGQAPVRIDKPVDFRYLDSEKVKELYSQLLPQLVEKTRKIATDNKSHVGMKADAGKDGIGSMGIESDRDEGSEQISELGKSEDSSSSDALAVINYCLTNHQLIFYSTEESWQVAYTLKTDAINSTSTLYPNQLPLPAARKASDSTDENDTQSQILTVSSQALKSELSGLTGLVLIDGTFELKTIGSISKLVDHFSKGSNKVEFVIELPMANSIKGLSSGAKLRVFGAVNHPLDNQGVVSIQPIAVF